MGGAKAQIDIIQCFKSKKNRYYLAAIVDGNMLLLEFVGINVLRIIRGIKHISDTVFFDIETGEVVEFKKEKFDIVPKDIINQILNKEFYQVIFEKNETFYTLTTLQEESEEEQYEPFNNFLAKPNVRLVLKKVQLFDDCILDTFLDRIKEVGIKNITYFEKESLNSYSQKS